MTNGYPHFSLISERGNKAAGLSHNEIEIVLRNISKDT